MKRGPYKATKAGLMVVQTKARSKGPLHHPLLPRVTGSCRRRRASGPQRLLFLERQPPEPRLVR